MTEITHLFYTPILWTARKNSVSSQCSWLCVLMLHEPGMEANHLHTIAQEDIVSVRYIQVALEKNDGVLVDAGSVQ